MPVEPEVPAVPAVVYARWGSRCLALVLDYLIVSIPIVVILENWNSSRGVEEWILVFGWPAILLTFAAYFVGFHGGKRGQTLGKIALRIAVRDETTFASIGHARAAVRLLVTTVLWSFFWIPGIVDSLWPLRDERAQSLHDKAAHTVVLRVGRGQHPRMLAFQLVGAVGLVVVAFYLSSLWAGSSAETASSPALLAAVERYNEHLLSDVTGAAADSVKRFGSSAPQEVPWIAPTTC